MSSLVPRTVGETDQGSLEAYQDYTNSRPLLAQQLAMDSLMAHHDFLAVNYD